MLEEEMIKLNPMQATAYFWTNRLMTITRNLIKSKNFEAEEERFVEIFYNYTDVEWRQLYLRLANAITEDINNYIPEENNVDRNSFSQDTNYGGHEILNNELAIITGEEDFPDIRLADKNSKDDVVFTNMFESSICNRTTGTKDLKTDYEPNYILTGDERELDFYNQFVTTLIALVNKNKNKKFKSTEKVRILFCQEYNRINKNISITQIHNLFNKCYEIARQRGIIIGERWEGDFVCDAMEYDLAGLENYVPMAKYLADSIIEYIADNPNNLKNSEIIM